MAVTRGDEFVSSTNENIPSKQNVNVNSHSNSLSNKTNESIDIENATEDREPLIDGRNDVHCDRSLNGQEQFEDSEFYTGFQKITTIPAAALSIVAGFIMIASVFAIPALCEKRPEPHHDKVGANPFIQCQVDSFSMLIYVHSLYWVAHLCLDPYLKKKHKENRIAGYLDFYLKTKNIRRAPFYLVSVGNFGLLIVMTILHDYCGYGEKCQDRFMKVDWLRGLITVECMTIMSLFSYYIIKMREFNRSQMPPDVLRDSYMRALRDNLVLRFDEQRPIVMNTNRTIDEMGDASRREEEAYQRNAIIIAQNEDLQGQNIRLLQAELIRFLIRQIKRKNKKVVALTQQLADQNT